MLWGSAADVFTNISVIAVADYLEMAILYSD